jgi:hypothetical protein
VLYKKPIRQPKQSLVDLPTYTIPEAATFLAMSTERLYDWYAGALPILVASGHVGNIHLLSFRNPEEAYKVFLNTLKAQQIPSLPQKSDERRTR